MSEYRRFKRLAKSLIPRFPRGSRRSYTHSDARMIINDLGLEIPPDRLDKLIQSDMVLEDFVNSIYQLEQKIRKPAITEFSTLDPELSPKAWVEEDEVGFSITWRGEELIFAEYDMR